LLKRNHKLTYPGGSRHLIILSLFVGSIKMETVDSSFDQIENKRWVCENYYNKMCYHKATTLCITHFLKLRTLLVNRNLRNRWFKWAQHINIYFWVLNKYNQTYRQNYKSLRITYLQNKGVTEVPKKKILLLVYISNSVARNFFICIINQPWGALRKKFERDTHKDVSE
jgi:hypothetical protein